MTSWLGSVHVKIVRWRRAAERRISDAWARVMADAWPVLQSTAAATVSWVIARNVFQHHQPFFAPIAAVAALNASRGERGTNAVRLLWGVFVGIAVAEVALAVLGGGYGTLTLATFVAMIVALSFGGGRVVIGQASASAILTVATDTPGVGPGRLVDALLGAGIALVVSQLVFPAEPLALLRGAEAAVLRDMGAALDLAARAVKRDEADLADRATDQLRSLRDRLADLGRTRESSRRAAKRSPRWWGRSSPIVRENEDAGQLDLLGTSALTLTRMVIDTGTDKRQELGPAVHELAGVLHALAAAPGDRDTRQHAADQALAAAATLPEESTGAETRLIAARTAVRRVAADTMVFAGVEPQQAVAAIRQGSGELKVSDPPARQGLRLPRPRLHLPRRCQRSRRMPHLPRPARLLRRPGHHRRDATDQAPGDT